MSNRFLQNAARPILALAPMQDVTNLTFWNIQAGYGAPDLYFTPYFRVHSVSRLDKKILRSITESPRDRQIVAQIIGHDIPSLVRTARELQEHPIVAIDLNLGCPAPIVCRKNVGGGLLRDPSQIEPILEALRSSIRIPFTVKTRLGYDSPEAFVHLLQLFNQYKVDLVTIHTRTVKQLYGGKADHSWIPLAVKSLRCPVLANGDIVGAKQASSILASTGAAGLMLGRGIVRNPWLFAQIQAHLGGFPVHYPTGRELLDYITALWQQSHSPIHSEAAHVERMKKYLNFFGTGMQSSEDFLFTIRRVQTEKEFFQTCRTWLDHGEPLTLTDDEPLQNTMQKDLADQIGPVKLNQTRRFYRSTKGGS